VNVPTGMTVYDAKGKKVTIKSVGMNIVTFSTKKGMKYEIK